jgi:DNA helicase-2/ATP-dependent DNA helicase PcrA
VKFGGLKFLEAAHIKDVLAVLRWAQNMRDRVAGFRVAQLLPGVGPGWASRLLDRMAESHDPARALGEFKPPAAAAEHWPEFEATIGLLYRNATSWPAEVDLVSRWYAPHLERMYEDAALRQADLGQLAQIAASYPGRERFLTELTLDPPDATSDEAGVPLLDEDYLILSTIHSAKGQEWTSVFLLNTVDGCLPSDLATGSTPEIEEERRLLYVAMTRAKDHLHLMVPQRFYTHGQRGNGDRHVYAQRTRFIPNTMLNHFKTCVWPPPRAAGTSGAKPMREPVDLRARMRGMWG